MIYHTLPYDQKQKNQEILGTEEEIDTKSLRFHAAHRWPNLEKIILYHILLKIR